MNHEIVTALITFFATFLPLVSTFVVVIFKALTKYKKEIFLMKNDYENIKKDLEYCQGKLRECSAEKIKTNWTK